VRFIAHAFKFEFKEKGPPSGQPLSCAPIVERACQVNSNALVKKAASEPFALPVGGVRCGAEAPGPSSARRAAASA
jgi:hypothetical protein